MTEFRAFRPLTNYLDYVTIANVPDQSCRLIVLDGPQIALIQAMLELCDLYRVWSLPHRSQWDASDTQQWDTIEGFLADTRYCLMSGCDVQDIIVALNEIRDAINNPEPVYAPATDSNDVIDEMATAMGVKDEWDLFKVGLQVLFPGNLVPIEIGVDVLRGLVQNENSNEAETWDIARILGSQTSNLPD